MKISSGVHENICSVGLGEIYLRITGTKQHTIGKLLHLSERSMCIAKVDDCWGEGFELDLLIFLVVAALGSPLFRP